MWVYFVCLFVLAFFFKVVEIVPGISLLILIAYFSSKVLAQAWQKQKFHRSGALILGVLLIFTFGTRLGKEFLKQSARPFVVYSLEKKLRETPDDTLAVQYLSTLYTAKNQYEKAMPLINSLLSKNPCDIVALGNRATLFYAKKEYKKSISDWKNAIHCDSTKALLWNQLALNFRVEKKEDSALIAWEKSLTLLKAGDPLYKQIQKQMKGK